MVDLIVKNGPILTMHRTHEIIQDGVITTKDTRAVVISVGSLKCKREGGSVAPAKLPQQYCSHYQAS